VWDPLLNGYYGLGGFQTISGATGYLPSPGGTIKFPTGVPVTEIQSGQAFLVHATGALGQMQFSESAKFNSTGNMVYRNSPTRNAMLTASMLTHQDVMADGNTVVFGNHFSNHYTSEDAIKYFNGGENFYLTRDGKNLSVETRKLPQHNDTLHYRIANLKTGTYTMKLAPVGFPHTNLKAYFIDKFSNRRVELSLYETISFSVEVTNDPSSKSAERFMVVFKQPELEDPYRNDVDPRVWITGNPVRGEKLFFQLNDFKSGMYVISIKTLNNKTLYSQSVYINEPAFKSALSLLASLPSATYLFTVTGAKTRVVTKWLKL
jgi:hypothetical protein